MCLNKKICETEKEYDEQKLQRTFGGSYLQFFFGKILNYLQFYRPFCIYFFLFNQVLTLGSIIQTRRQPASVPFKALDMPPRPRVEPPFPQPKPKGTTGLSRPGTILYIHNSFTKVMSKLNMLKRHNYYKKKKPFRCNYLVVCKVSKYILDQFIVSNVRTGSQLYHVKSLH